MRNWITLVIVAVCALSCTVSGTEEEHLSRVKRVVNGTQVNNPPLHCSWPYMVIVEKRCVETGDIPFRCAGNIISAGRILTNKQCVLPDFPTNINCHEVVIRVIAGARVHDDVQERTRQMRWVTHVLEHDDADLAMLVLESDLQITEGVVETIALADVDQALNYPAMAAGWGTSNVARPFLYTDTLYEIKLFVRHYEVGLLFYSTSIFDVFREHSGVNQGDSGGPIVVYRGNQTVCENPMLVAVTNCFLPVGNCGHWRQARHPNVYYHREWIQEMLTFLPTTPEPTTTPTTQESTESSISTSPASTKFTTPTLPESTESTTPTMPESTESSSTTTPPVVESGASVFSTVHAVAFSLVTYMTFLNLYIYI